MQIEGLTSAKASQVAKLHIDGIVSGFISSLGRDFVTALYEAIANDDNSFGFMATDDGRVVGFIAVSRDLSSLYKHVAKSGSFKFVFILARKMFSFRIIKKIVDNLFYPSKMKKAGLPDAELLSIVVSDQCRGKGVAKQLVEKSFEQCRSYGIDKMKVLVAADNQPANKLYKNSGFKLHSKIESHGVKSNVYVVDLVL